MWRIREAFWCYMYLPTDLLPTTAIFRCFCCGGMVADVFSQSRDVLCGRLPPRQVREVKESWMDP